MNCRLIESLMQREGLIVTDYTPSQIQSLSGRDLDRAACELWPEIATKTGMHSWPAAGIPSLHSEAALLHLAFEPGGPLEPTKDRWFSVNFLSPIEVVRHTSVGQREWNDWEEDDIASGPTIEVAVWRASCIVALEKGKPT